MTLAAAIVTAKDGVLLIDEIGTAIYTKASKSFFEWFVKVCKKQNVQVFVTTHSIEAIDAILEGGKSHLEDIAGYRLEEDQGQIYVDRFSGEKLHDIRFKMVLDVR